MGRKSPTFLKKVLLMSIKTIENGTLTYLRAEGIRVPHCFTTRLGGVSEGYLSSMNIGTHRGDAPENVLENYRILGRELGFSPENLVLTRQTHTDTVKVVGMQERGAGLLSPELPECDALVTNTPGIALVVFTADCTPILLWDSVTGAVGAVHAGWRGTASCIGEKAVQAMTARFGSNPEHIHAAIGPNIGMCCFETDVDVPDAMVAAVGEAALPHIRRAGGKYHVDLKAINALILNRAGVSQVEISTECTACRTDLFWSHRRMGSLRGSQGGIIVCEGVGK